MWLPARPPGGRAPSAVIPFPVANLSASARLATRLLAANLSNARLPVKLNVALTYRCQYRCTTCNIWQLKPKGELTTDEVLRFVARNRFLSWVDLTGGEIFLREDIAEIFAAIARDWDRLAYLHFPTNGFLTDRIVRVVEVAARSTRAALVVTVSVDGDEALNDEVRGIKGGYRRQLETLTSLRRIPNVRAVVGVTLSRRNVGRLEQTIQACLRDCPGLTLDDFSLNVMQLSDHYYGNADLAEARPERAAVLAAITAFRRLAGSPGLSPELRVRDAFLANLERFVATGRNPMRCHALRSSCFIDPWGTVFPCITYSRPLGSLREHDMDLRPIWESEQARAVQAEIWRDQCPQCWTACEASQSILGNVLRPAHRRPDRPT